jgi:hypothetical protein
MAKDKKELNFRTRIRNRRRQIPRTTMISGMDYLYFVYIIFKDFIGKILVLGARCRVQGAGS